MQRMAFRGSSLAPAEGTTESTKTVTFPGTTAAGDLLILQLTSQDSGSGSHLINNQPPASTGWQPVGAGIAPAGGYNSFGWYKIADGSEAGTQLKYRGYTAGTYASLQLAVYAGPCDVMAGKVNGTSSTATTLFASAASSQAWNSGGYTVMRLGFMVQMTSSSTFSGLSDHTTRSDVRPAFGFTHMIYDRYYDAAFTDSTSSATTNTPTSYSFVSLLARYNGAPTPPGAFTNPTAGQVVNNSLEVAWGAATDPEAGPPFYDAPMYSLQYSSDGGATWSTQINSQNFPTTYTFDTSALPATTTARLRVRSHDRFKDGTFSAWVTSPTFTINHEAPPNAPMLLGPTADDPVPYGESYQFSWIHQDPGNKGQKSFEGRYRKVGDTTWIGFGQATNFQYYDMPPLTGTPGQYEWQLRTTNTSDLTGAWSNLSTFVLQAPPKGRGVARLVLRAIGRGLALLFGRGRGIARVTARAGGVEIVQGRGAARLRLRATGRGRGILSGVAVMRLRATGRGASLHFEFGQGNSLARLTAHGRGVERFGANGGSRARLRLRAEHLLHRARYRAAAGTSRLVPVPDATSTLRSEEAA